METPRDLAQRWRDRATTLESGDGAAKLAAYNLRFAADELDNLSLPTDQAERRTQTGFNDGHHCDFPIVEPGDQWECPVCHWRWMAVEDINWTAVNE